MLGGEYSHNLDAKNRIFIPAKLREELGETFVLVKALRGKCLKIYSKAEWEKYIAPLRRTEKRYPEEILPDRKLSERTLRFLHASLQQVTPDTQGRIVLPQELVSFAEIERNVTIVGCCDYAEIWAEESYQKMRAEENIDEMIAELEALGL